MVFCVIFCYLYQYFVYVFPGGSWQFNTKKEVFPLKLKVQIITRVHAVNDFFYSVIRFTLFALGLQLSIGYIFIFFHPDFVLVLCNFKLVCFFSVSQNSAHVKWNNGICFCQASGFRIVSIKRFCADKEYMEFHSCIYGAFDIYPKGM